MFMVLPYIHIIHCEQNSELPCLLGSLLRGFVIVLCSFVCFLTALLCVAHTFSVIVEYVDPMVSFFPIFHDE